MTEKRFPSFQCLWLSISSLFIQIFYTSIVLHKNFFYANVNSRRSTSNHNRVQWSLNVQTETVITNGIEAAGTSTAPHRRLSLYPSGSAKTAICFRSSLQRACHQIFYPVPKSY